MGKMGLMGLMGFMRIREPDGEASGTAACVGHSGMHWAAGVGQGGLHGNVSVICH